VQSFTTRAGVILVYVLKIFIYRIRMTVTQSSGLVITSDFFSGTALGSSLLPVEARLILSLSLYQNDMLKIFIYFYFFIPRFFTHKKYLQKPL
jgi:hypothetical protein